jgi:hypothetical protein
MTVSSTTSKASYTGNGLTTSFAVPFYFLAAADLQVILRSGTTETVQALTTNYTVSGAGNEAGGTVTMLVAPASGTTLTIRRSIAATQGTDLLPNDRLPAEDLEDGLDKLTMIAQQLGEESDRSIKFPASDAAVSAQVPAASARASKFLSFDANGLPVATVGVDATLDIFTQAGTGAVARSVNDKLREIVSVDDFIPAGIDTATADCTQYIKNATARINALGGGTLSFGAGKTYLVLATGGVSGGNVVYLQNAVGVLIEGNGARILTGNVTIIQRFFDFDASSNIVIRNLRMESGYASLDFSAGIDWIVTRSGTNQVVLENLDISYGRVGFSALGQLAGEGVDSNRVRDITALNLNFFGCYYPLNFRGAGDNFFARGISARNCGRAYFPQNCRNHDIVLTSEQGGPFSDVLLKVYGSTAFYSRLENIKIVYNSPGRFVTAAAQSADEAMVGMDFQLYDTNPGPCFMQNIDVTFNVEANNASLNRSLFIVRKYDSAGNADTTGSRGHELINMTLRGVGRSLQNLQSDAIRLFTRASENWSGEFVSNVSVSDFNLGNISSQTAIAMNGAALSGPFSIKRVSSPGALSLSNMTDKPFSFEESSFNGVLAKTTAPQMYTPVWTADTTDPAIGNGTLTGSYTTQGKLCTVQIFMSAGSTTTFGTGPWRFSLPLQASNDSINTIGAAFGLDSGTAFFTGVCYVAQNASLLRCVLGNSVGNEVTSAVPFTWATNDYLRLTITYPIK